jgi:EmrB/QacA subfamily drug resistance transporter
MSDPAPDPRRWRALAVIAIAQLMIVLDITIVNIALPSAQKDLGISTGDRQWVVTAYTLAFGGLLLLGGRLGDLYGRKRTFMIGLLGFATASALGGAALTPGMLFFSRALQGAFGALLAPSALGLLSTTFSNARERATAFGIFGAIAAGGSAVGFIVGGLLTEYLNWRWCLFVNTPIALATALAAYTLLKRDHIEKGKRIALDLPGVALGCGGLVAIVYGTSEAESRGWGDSLVLSCLILGALLEACFVLVEKRSTHALLPLHIVRDRNRGGAALSVGLAVIGLFGMFLFLTYYLQTVKGFSPLLTGVAFLPMTAAIILSSTGVAARMMNKVPSRNLIVPGLLLGGAGMAWLTQMRVGSPYAAMVLPGELLLGLGMGLVFMPSMNLATLGVAPRETGAAAATINTAQQVGGSIGTALLNTIAASATTAYLVGRNVSSKAVRDAGAVHGYSVAAWVAFGIFLLAAVVAFVMVDHRPSPEEEQAEGRTDEQAAAQAAQRAAESEHAAQVESERAARLRASGSAADQEAA